MQMYVSAENCRAHPHIAPLVRRMYQLARMPPGHGEATQIGRYLAGEFYEPHYDSEQATSARLSRTRLQGMHRTKEICSK